MHFRTSKKMKKKDVERILKKKNPTAEELGRLYVANESATLRPVSSGGTGALYDEDVYLDSVRLIEAQDEKDLLEFYVTACDMLLLLSQALMRYEAGFADGYNQLLIKLGIAVNAEKAEARANLLPYTMSDRDYLTLYETTKHNKQNRTETLENATVAVIASVFDNEILHATHHARFGFLISRELEILMDRPVENDEIVNKYKAGAFAGLYQIEETGRLVTRQGLVNYMIDWRRSKADSQEFFNLTRAFYQGAKTVRRIFTKQRKIISEALKDEKRFFEVLEAYLSFQDISLTSNLLERVFDEYLAGGEKLSSFVREPIDEVTSHNVLSAIFEQDQHTPQTLVNYFFGEDSDIAYELQRRFSSLWEAVQMYIKEAHPEEDMTWGSLARAGIPIYQQSILPKPDDLADAINANWNIKERIRRVGIAVIKEESRSTQDEYTEFLEPSDFDLYHGVLHVSEAEKRAISDASEFVERGACRIFDVNTTLDCLTKLFGVGALAWARQSEKEIRQQISAVNKAIYLAYLGMTGDREAKEKKRARFKELFREFDLNWLESPKDTAKLALLDFHLLKAQRDFKNIKGAISTLMVNLNKNRS